jgi:hypothetical protein
VEFKLNKIDTDIRKKMKEEIKDDKVHSGKSISVKKDIKDEKKQYIKQDDTKEENQKRYITIDGIKDKNIDIKVEKLEQINDGNSKGRVLDRKR